MGKLADAEDCYVHPAVWVKRYASDGDTIVFGAYEQDNDLTNGKETIEWQVLEAKSDRAFMISEYALDCQTYNKKSMSITWEK